MPRMSWQPPSSHPGPVAGRKNATISGTAFHLRKPTGFFLYR
jgi:hypothetical protein